MHTLWFVKCGRHTITDGVVNGYTPCGWVIGDDIGKLYKIIAGTREEEEEEEEEEIPYEYEEDDDD